MAILQTLNNPNGSRQETMEQEIARLKAELAAAKAKGRPAITVKVKPLGGQDKDGNAFKGNVAVYGLGKYPVTLYPGQWQELAKVMGEVLEQIEENRDVLSWKD